MHKRLLISLSGVAAVLCGLALPSVLQAQTLTVGPGWNCFDTSTTAPFATTYASVPWEGVPLGTFDFGGGPTNVGNTDTIIQRLPPPINGYSITDMPVVVRALQLQTVNQVSLGGGPVGYYYATLDTNAQNTGLLYIDSFPTNGSPGTFHDSFDVYFDVRYGSLTGPIVAPEQSLTLYASGDWLAALPLPTNAIPIMHHDPQTNDVHYVTIDPVPDMDGGFVPFDIPEPSSLSLLAFGMFGIVFLRRRLS